MRWWTLQKLKASDPKSRLEAIAELQALEREDAFEHLSGALSDGDAAVRRAAVLALGWSADARAVARIAPLLQDRAPEVRAAVVEALAAAKEAGRPGLIQALRDPSSDVKWRAAQALNRQGWQPTTDHDRALFLVAQGDLEKAASLGSVAIEAIAPVLREGVFYRRVNAVQALRAIGDVAAIKVLLGAVADEDPQVRAVTITALGELGDARALEPVMTALRDPEAQVRAQAAEALSRLGDERAIDPLTGTLNHPNWEVRRAAVLTLGRLNAVRVLPEVAQLLKDKNREVREAVVLTLERFRSPAAVPFLVPALADEDERVRSTAAGVLRKLDDTWEISAAARKAIPELKAALKHREYWVRQAAADALAKLGEVRPVEPRLAGLLDPSQWRRQASRDALTAMLSDADQDFRRAAAEALGRAGDSGSADALVQVLRDGDPAVRRAAAHSLKALKWQPRDAIQRAEMEGAL